MSAAEKGLIYEAAKGKDAVRRCQFALVGEANRTASRGVTLKRALAGVKTLESATSMG